ncbi:MAG: hypothetical protein J7M08_00945 [Planctomycetes bacterium]|nr:hypothetical protein [Planctomycetota bacterium]
MKALRVSWVVVVAVALACCAGWATADEVLKLKPEVQKVALFKNGLGYFLCTADVPGDGPREFSIGPLLAASHGSFWVSWPEGTDIGALIASEVAVEQMQPARSTMQLLKANAGRKALVRLRDEGGTLQGVIRVPPEAEDEPWPAPYFAGRSATRRIPPPRQAEFVLLESEAKTVALFPRDIQTIQFAEAPRGEFARPQKEVRLTGRLGKDTGPLKLAMDFLAKGITWAPSYAVDISRGENAFISAKAVIINEAADLDGAHVDLVTGFPHLRYSDVVSPMAMKESLAEFLASLEQGEGRRELRRMAPMMQQMASSGAGWGGGVAPAYQAAREGRSAEDLFLYPLDDVHLKKGQTGYYPLFTEKAPYEHVYEWEVADYLTEQERYQGPQQQGVEKEEEVWHSLRLENTTPVPWTTAPAETIKDGQILGQDLIKYTPSGDKATLRITRAMAVKAEQAEYETERQRNAAQFYGRTYDQVTLRGEMTVTNFKDETITLEVKKTLSGKLISAEPQADVKSTAKGLKRVNPVHELTWTLDLGAGRTREITYSYQVLVRR